MSETPEFPVLAHRSEYEHDSRPSLVDTVEFDPHQLTSFVVIDQIEKEPTIYRINQKMGIGV